MTVGDDSAQYRKRKNKTKQNKTKQNKTKQNKKKKHCFLVAATLFLIGKIIIT